MADIADIIRLFRKLSPSETEASDMINRYVSKSEHKYIRTLLKQRKLDISLSRWDVSKKMISDFECPKLIPKTKDRTVSDYVEKINSKIWAQAQNALFEKFSHIAAEKLTGLIADEIVGFKYVKKAAALQLFSKEHFHILLLGDPGTGKTKVLKSASEFSPVASFGLGSGTSGAGLAVTVKGKEIVKGLLPMADTGLCAIDELNLMKEESRASLYSAMEDGYVTYNKGGHHYKFNARISIIATANPIGDKFKGHIPSELRKQLPFDSALLSRFHLTFLLRKPNLKQFKDISRKILSKRSGTISAEDKRFIQEYVRHANDIKDISLPKTFEKEIVDFVARIKEKEDDYLIEVSPRLVVGFTMLAKASARMELRDTVHQNDIELVKQIILNSLEIK